MLEFAKGFGGRGLDGAVRTIGADMDKWDELATVNDGGDYGVRGYETRVTPDETPLKDVRFEGVVFVDTNPGAVFIG